MKDQFHFVTEKLDPAPRKILVCIPTKHHKLLLEKCELWRGEYAILKNGVVRRDSDGEEVVAILCDVIHAKLLLDLAHALYPLAAPYIRESMKLDRKSGED